MATIQKIMPSLWFDDNAEEAVKFYVSVFENSKTGRIAYYTKEGFEYHGKPAGSVMSIEFTIEGQNFIALNGGPIFHFNEAISLYISCDTQEEIDRYWYGLLANGGEEVQCGWLKDSFGVSWQIAPSILPAMLTDPDIKKIERVTRSYLQMKKFNIDALKRAFEGNE